MKRVKQLREQQAKIVHDARAALEEITEDTPQERADELNAQFDKAMDEHDRIEEIVQREMRLYRAQDTNDDIDPRAPLLDGEIDPDERHEDPTPEYREVFDKYLRTQTEGGISDLSREERQILRQGHDPEARAQAVGSDAAGGYTVPEDFANEIDIQLAMWGPMYEDDFCRTLNTTNGRDFPIPTTNDTGNTGRIKAENAAADDDGTDDVVFGEVRLGAFMYDTGVVRVPYELLQDSFFDLDSLMAELFGERLGRTANSALTTGTGSAQPNGIVTAAGVGVTAAAPTAVTSDEIIDLQHSVDPAYRQSPKCRWQFNDTTLGYIRKLKDGQGNYLWQMGDVRTGEPATLLGHPYAINQAVANITNSARSMIFGDHSRYWVRKVRGFSLLTLRERYAENLQVGLLAFKRLDGDLANSNAIKAMVQPAT